VIGKKGVMLKSIDLSNSFNDDPSQSFIFIFGREGTSTTTLALSIVDIIEEDKKIYVLNTEPPHNETGIIMKHYAKEHADGRFILPAKKGTQQVIPITSRSEYYIFRDKALADENIGAFIIDAIDTLRLMLFGEFSKKNKFAMKAWMDADQEIIKLFMMLLEKQIPVIVILKEKEKTIVTQTSEGVNVTKTGEIVPTLDNERIQRWASIRLQTTEIGSYTVVKTKGAVDINTEFKFVYNKETNERTGVWIPQLLAKMRNE
jgi:hypothetical protein